MSRTEEAFRHLAKEVAQIRRDLDTQRARDDRLNEAAFDKLHQELQQYKRGFFDDVQRPLLADLLMLFDRMQWFQATMIDQELPQSTIADHFQFLVEELLDVLERRDVVPMAPQETFDKARQKAVRLKPTDDPGQDQSVARVIKRGFTQGDRVFRPEEVEVYRYRERT